MENHATGLWRYPQCMQEPCPSLLLQSDQCHPGTCPERLALEQYANVRIIGLRDYLNE